MTLDGEHGPRSAIFAMMGQRSIRVGNNAGTWSIRFDSRRQRFLICLPRQFQVNAEQPRWIQAEYWIARHVCQTQSITD